MQYSISQMAELFGVKPHTLRFYEKEGILTPQRTKSGVRTYTEESKAQMELTMCLKSTGMPLKDIKRYFDLVKVGDSTLEQRLEIFTDHGRHVLEEIDTLQNHLFKIEYKIQWCQNSLKAKNAEKSDRFPQQP